LPAPTPAPAPALSGDWRDWPLTPGDWSYRRNGAVTEAVYGQPGAIPVLMMQCATGARQIRMTWATAAAGPLTVRTSYGDVPRAAGRTETGLAVNFTPRDALLDQMAFSRGRFMLIANGQELIVPAWPEVARVVEDCR
jgi:hypothetical protein